MAGAPHCRAHRSHQSRLSARVGLVIQPPQMGAHSCQRHALAGGDRARRLALEERERDVVVLVERETLLAIVLLASAVALFEHAGYAASTFLFLWGSFVLIGREPWLPAALFAGTATILTWALFVKALGVALPAGIVSLP